MNKIDLIAIVYIEEKNPALFTLLGSMWGQINYTGLPLISYDPTEL